MPKVIFTEESLNEIIGNLNSLEFTPNRNIANSLRLVKIYEILNTGTLLHEDTQPALSQYPVE